jgi:dihydroneopterin aldolase
MKGNLRTHMEDKELQTFVKQAKSYGLLAGLAGSLKASDIPPLLQLEPDYLGFRGALCQDNLRIQALNSSSVRNIRSLITNTNNDSERVRAGTQ